MGGMGSVANQGAGRGGRPRVEGGALWARRASADFAHARRQSAAALHEHDKKSQRRQIAGGGREREKLIFTTSVQSKIACRVFA